MVSTAFSSCQPTRHGIFWLTFPCKFHCAMKTCLLIVTAVIIYRPLACCTMQAFVAISPVFVPAVPLLAAPCKFSCQSPQYLFLPSPCLLHHASFRVPVSHNLLHDHTGHTCRLALKRFPHVVRTHTYPRRKAKGSL